MIYDISPPLAPDLAVFPGDTPLSREVLLDMRRGDHITLSTLHATAHLGAHLDGPNHYGRDAEGVDAIDLARCMGPCRVVVVDVRRGELVTIDHLPDPIDATRLLLRTGTYPDPHRWEPDYAGLDPALVDHLHEHGVDLVGVDTPSVDPSTSQDLPAHRRFLAAGMLILEGLVLGDVEPGTYDLIALPLRLVGFDASPVRAVLVG